MSQNLNRCAVIILLALFGRTASAQSTRTWISGVGDDVNPCTRTAPCKTFAGAISKTAAGGEINVLDSGGFGSLTITKPITIDGGGALAGIIGSGVSGVVINTAGPGDTVVLRNLAIDGINQTATPGTNGVRIINGRNVHIENCVIFGFSSRGVSIETSALNTTVSIRNTVIRSNGEGIGSFPVGGSVQLTLSGVQADQNSGHALNLQTATSASIATSHLALNGASGVIAWSTSVSVDLDRTTISRNNYGIYAGYLGGTPTIRVSHSSVAGNSTGILLNGGTVIGFQNNMIAGNSTGNSVSFSQAQQ